MPLLEPQHSGESGPICVRPQAFKVSHRPMCGQQGAHMRGRNAGGLKFLAQIDLEIQTIAKCVASCGMWDPMEGARSVVKRLKPKKKGQLIVFSVGPPNDFCPKVTTLAVALGQVAVDAPAVVPRGGRRETPYGPTQKHTKHPQT